MVMNRGPWNDLKGIVKTTAVMESLIGLSQKLDSRLKLLDRKSSLSHDSL
jgi:hypothetical protein